MLHDILALPKQVSEAPAAGDQSATTCVLLRVRCTVSTLAQTGVEMEAMTGASLAALTLYDMLKSGSKGIEIREVRLLRKTGGKSGDYSAGGSA